MGSRRRRRRGRRLTLWSAAGVLVLGALVALAFVFPPSTLFSSEKPSAKTGETVPAAVGNPEARIAIVGDTGTRNKWEAATAERIELQAEQADAPYDALLILGDMIYPNGDSAQTQASITDPFARTLEDATLIPVLGNHDVQSDEEDEILTELGRNAGYYVEQIGPMRVIVLDSNRVGNAKQLTWLKGVLAEEQPPGTWTIAAMHHPAYSAGHHGSTKSVQREWSPLFEEAGVQLVFAGHDHDYQRSTPQNGITYVVSGAGAKLRRSGSADFTAVSTATRHFLELLVYDDRLEGRAIDQQGKLIDSFTIER